MSSRGRSDHKVVQLHMPRGRSGAAKRPIRLTEEERQILLSELAEVTAALNEIQARTMEIAARVIEPAVRHDRPA
ncbi:hypothetical protein [Actinomadura xylanilytica]|uniref:hypothetical protein n=1 Tax=Actinomadura xylanilytica TaxID=887459 RepID=UPI00255A92A6|nr:hypothetical protein [Actinomadura xylanilytica]MDL4776361.1 hypothetical protein [Actinomadura xylanilytica]